MCFIPFVIKLFSVMSCLAYGIFFPTVEKGKVSFVCAGFFVVLVTHEVCGKDLAVITNQKQKAEPLIFKCLPVATESSGFAKLLV